MSDKEPQTMADIAKERILTVIDSCAGSSGCDVCRLHMDEDYLFSLRWEKQQLKP
ncbi:MAG: hypothetical protein KAI40_09525 [Desulfobacterales bacterium]|nr:hypothetical protein [Desulfobacterales bacterium]